MLRLAPTLEFEQLLPAADAVLSKTSGADADLATAVCMAAGLPVVRMGQPRTTAQELLELRTDPGKLGELGARCKSDAESYFNLERFSCEYQSIYAEIGRRDTAAEAAAPR